MSQVASWNMRGLNWPNKQEDVKLFLHQNNIGLVGLIETKIRRQNVDTIASTLLHGWQWANNCDISNGRIWVAWKPNFYHLTILEKTNQFIHCEATQLITSKHFHITLFMATTMNSRGNLCGTCYTSSPYPYQARGASSGISTLSYPRMSA